MPITTAEQRKAASGVPFLPQGPGVTNDAAQGASWRAEAGWGYHLEGIPPHPGIGRDVTEGLGQKKTFSTGLELGGGSW